MKYFAGFQTKNITGIYCFDTMPFIFGPTVKQYSSKKYVYFIKFETIAFVEYTIVKKTINEINN